MDGRRLATLALISLSGVTAHADEGTPLTHYALTNRATSLNPLNAEVSFSVRTSAGAGTTESQFSGQVGLAPGLNAFVQASRGLIASDWKPGVGLQWQFAGGAGQPVAMSVASQFRKGALTEPDGEGEIDLMWFGTYRENASELSINLLAGSDLDGDTKHFEGRMAAGRHLMDQLMAGVEAEGRWADRSSKVDLSGDEGAELNSTKTAFAGPFLQYRIERLTFSTAVGFSTYVEETQGAKTQAQGIFGVGFSF